MCVKMAYGRTLFGRLCCGASGSVTTSNHYFMNIAWNGKPMSEFAGDTFRPSSFNYNQLKMTDCPLTREHTQAPAYIMPCRMHTKHHAAAVAAASERMMRRTNVAPRYGASLSAWTTQNQPPLYGIGVRCLAINYNDVPRHALRVVLCCPTIMVFLFAGLKCICFWRPLVRTHKFGYYDQIQFKRTVLLNATHTHKPNSSRSLFQFYMCCKSQITRWFVGIYVAMRCHLAIVTQRFWSACFE